VRVDEQDVAAVAAATDLVALVGEHVALRASGARWVGLCPFHSEKTPSFYVSPAFGRYHCFGCDTSGDAIDFLRAVEHLDFVEAVERLAERAGITLRALDPKDGARRAKRGDLIEVMERAVSWYHRRLMTGADAGPARSYLASRGYGTGTIRRFQLGWAPEDWDGLTKALGLSDAVLRDTGLGFVNKAGRRQDAFRARLMFPIFDTGGRPVAFGGRVLPGAPETEPKYKNSAESAIYSKRKVLYGLNWARDEVARTGEVVVCEGYTDVIALAEAGVGRAVATCGTSLAEEHFGVLRNFARRVVLAYDADRAGQAAAERFYEWERRHELEIAVADLPAGSDPAELGQRDPEALRAAIGRARTFLSFRVERILAGAELGSAEGRARAASTALAAVAEHPDPLVRDQYVMQIGARCRIEADQLRTAIGQLRRTGGASRRKDRPSSAPRSPAAPPGAPGAGGPGAPGTGGPGTPGAGGPGAGGPGAGGPGAPGAGGPGTPEARPSPPAGSRLGSAGHSVAAPPSSPPRHGPTGSGRLELECLRLAVHRPDVVAGRLDEVCFEDPIHRAAFRALRCSGTLAEAIASAEPAVGALLSRLAVEEANADPEVELPRLVGVAARRVLNWLGGEIKAEPSRASELAPSANWLRQGIEALNDPATSDDSAAQLLAWLGGMAPRDALSGG
jgi:DNA primase